MSEEETAFDDGKWHAMTLGHFISLLVDAGDNDVAIVMRVVKDSVPDKYGDFSRTMIVDLLPNGHVLEHLGKSGVKRVHKTLKKLIAAGLVK